MSSELERRLEGLFGELPEPDPEVGERALASAMAALEPATPRRRGLRTGALVFAAVCVLLAIAAGSLAAAGALHVSFGKQPRSRPAAGTLTLPHGAAGILAVVYGRLSVTTKNGFHLQGLPVTAAALSPHALYVAAGVGDSLVAMAPDGRRAWSYAVGASVAAIAWAPDGFRIAYLVRAGRRLTLHVIWGNGTHDTVIDRNAGGAMPSWRADSLSFAYVGPRGRPIVYDLAHESRQVIRNAIARGATRLAFAPSGRDLAVQTETAVLLVGARDHLIYRGEPGGVGWLGSQLVVAGRTVPEGRSFVRLYAVGPSGTTLRRAVRLPGPLLAINGRLVIVSGKSLLAGRLGALRSVLRFRLKGCNDDSGLASYTCEIPIGKNDVQIR